MNNLNKLKMNIIYNALYQAFILIIPMITLPYLTRIFNPSDLGINSYIASIVQIFITISFWGINNYGGRAIAFQKNSFEINKTFWEIWFIQIIFSSISFVIFIFFITFLKPNNIEYYFIQSFSILFTALEISWFFVGIEEMKKVVFRNTIIKILTTLLIFICIKDESQLSLYMIINTGGILIGNITLLFSLRKHIVKIQINKSDLLQHMRKSSIFLIPQFSILVYTSMDKMLLGQYSDLEQVGYYDQAQKIIRIVIVFITSATTALMPRMSYLISNNKEADFLKLFEKAVSYILLISFYFATITVSISDPFVIFFFGDSYRGIIPLMKITSLIGVFIPLGTLLWNGLLIPQGQDKTVVKSTIYAASISIFLNLIFDYRYGALGAVVALCCTELFIFLYRLYYAKRIYNFKKFILDFLKLSLISVITIVLTRYIRECNSIDSNFLLICFLGGSSTIIYLSLLIFIKNNTILELRDEVKKIYYKFKK